MSRQKNHALIAIITAEEVPELNFEDLCSACQVSPDFVKELILYGTIEPQGGSYDTWRFNAEHIHIIRTAIRLQHDLEVNHAGIALAIDLISQLESMRRQLEILEKHFNVRTATVRKQIT